MVTAVLSSFQRRIIMLIAIITVINFIDRSAISFVIEPLTKEFGISNSEFGIIAAAFGIGYFFTTFFGGMITDRFGTIGTWAVSAVLWSLATMLLALGKGYWSFFWIRVFLGLAEGLHFPALVRTVTDWIPGPWRARATALGLFGIPFASILGAPIVASLVGYFGWKVMFVVLGSFGIIWAALWLIHFRHHPQVLFAAVSSIESKEGTKKKMPWGKIVGNRSFWASCCIYFAFGYTIFFALMWLPGYLHQRHGASVIAQGLLVLPPWIVGASCMLLGGWLSDYLLRKTHSLRIARSYIIGSALMLSGLCFIAMLFSQGLLWDIVWLSLGVGVACAMHPPIFSLNADLFGSHAGSAQGITSAFFALAGIAGPAVTGYLTSATGGYAAAFTFLIILSLGTSSAVLVFQKPDRELRLA